MISQKVQLSVIPAQAGIQNHLIRRGGLDSRLRGNDDKGYLATFYETIKTTQNGFIFAETEPI